MSDGCDAADPGGRLQAALPVMSFGETLRELRVSRGLSLRQAAPQLSTSAPQLSRLERGTIPADPVVALAAEALFSEELRARNATGRLPWLASTHAPAGTTRVAARSHRTGMLRPPELLLGRDKETVELRSAVRANGLVVVHGLPGVGKSALVSSVAHTITTTRRDEVLVAQTTDSTDAELAYKVLGGWLADLGVAEQEIPAHTEERVQLLSARITPTRGVLMIVEDVARSEHVQPLLRLVGRVGSTLVVTSRNHLRELALRGGARPVAVAPLPNDAGAEMLRVLLPGDRVGSVSPDLLAAISRFCGGLPLAIERVAGQIARDARLTLARMHELLGDDARRLDLLGDPDDARRDLRCALTDVYATLPGEARWLFRLLGLHEGPIVTLPTAAALAGQNTELVLRGLLSLSEAHLLEPAGPGHWRWPDLPRLVAGELVRRTENPFQLMHAAGRIARWLLHAAASAASAREAGEQDNVHQRTLAAEAANLAALTAMAARYGHGGLDE